MKIKYIIDIVFINIIYYINKIKSLFTDIDYLRFIDANGNIKTQYIPFFFWNTTEKMEIKHLNSKKKIISNSLNDLYSINKKLKNETLISEFRINENQNLSTLINDYIDDTKINDILNLNKININNDTPISITLFKKIPINKKFIYKEISNLTINQIKSL